jgi:predicted Zn-dependent peptidase
MTKRYVVQILLTLLLLTSAAWAQTVNFKEYKLKNGLRVILSEDHNAPTYSIAVTYNAGSRDELPGHTGFAHLFEHMMFQGSENVGKGEHLIIVENNGGNVNGNTTPDRTQYFETLPSNQMDLGLFIEADRMRSLAITQANLDNQRATVQEERRQRYDNQPYGKTFEAIYDLTFDDFAYKHSTIGSMEDLNAASLKDVSAFFRTYYAPNNAVLTLVGDFDSAEVMKNIEKYFDDIPQQNPPPAPNMTEPKQTAERRKTIEDPLAQLPRLDILYKIPAGNTPDFYAMDYMGDVLSQGQSSRLYLQMVKEKELVTNVSCGPELRRGPGLFWCSMNVRPGKDPAEVEKTLYEELDKLKNEPITDAEVEKERMAVKRNEAEQLQSTLGRASEMGEFAVFFSDPDLINSYGKKLLAESKAQLQQAAKTYLTPANRTVVLTLPKPKQEEK